MNLLAGESRGGRLSIAGVELAGATRDGPDGPVTVGVRPTGVRLGPQGLPARVELVEDLGDSAIVDLLADGALVKMRTEGRPAVTEGEQVRIAFDAAALHVFDPATGLRR
jgi:ABC-type sugar transport system ATPase subunit